MDLNDLASNPEQIKNLIAILESLLPKDDQHTTKDTKQNQNFVNSKIKTKNTKIKKDNHEQNNKFLSMPERHMHKEDTDIDKILCQHPPVARAREFEPVKVRCRVCNKEEMIHPGLAYDLKENRYKCNRCSTSAG